MLLRFVTSPSVATLFWKGVTGPILFAILVLLNPISALSSCTDIYPTDLILENGTVVMDTDSGVWYMVCNSTDTNDTSCLPYGVVNSTNMTCSCEVPVMDRYYNSSIPWIWSTNFTCSDPTGNNTVGDHGVNNTLLNQTTCTSGNGSDINTVLDYDECFNDNMKKHNLLCGNVAYLNYTNIFNVTWYYGVATFIINGSLELGSSLRVKLSGQNALRVISIAGDVIINATVHADLVGATVNCSNETQYTDIYQHLGGFGSKLNCQDCGGPGQAAPNSSDGAGHGGMGGASNASFWYSFPYLVNNTCHLVGGSAGGVPSDVVLQSGARGGGAIEIIATEAIQINSEITARGQDGSSASMAGSACGGGGGSGGLIRLMAKHINISETGSLLVEGGHSSSNASVLPCGGGGAGGVVQLIAKESCEIVGVVNVTGGVGWLPGEEGTIYIRNLRSGSSREKFVSESASSGSTTSDAGVSFPPDVQNDR